MQKVKIRQLGTAAAERIPAIFCKCEICENAKTEGGKELRSQAQALVNDDLLIDFGGDSYMHYLRDDLPYADIGDLLVTHWHSDHFYGEDLAFRMHGYGNDFEKLMTVYSTETVQEFYQRAFGLEQMRDPSRLRFVTVKGGDSFEVADGKYKVHAFDARHGHNYGDCVFYGITDGDKSILYMHDTAYPEEKTWRQLEDAGVVYDYVTMDCTSGYQDIESTVHMGLADNDRVRDRLRRLGLVHDNTVFVANHFSHNARASHQQLEEIAGPMGIRIAYDGMETEL